MTASAADASIKTEDTAKAKTGGRLDLALAMHIAACRFSSPAGIAFAPQNYLPHLLPRKG